MKLGIPRPSVLYFECVSCGHRYAGAHPDAICSRPCCNADNRRIISRQKYLYGARK